MSDICCDILRFYCKITIFSNNVICVIKCLQSITSFVQLFEVFSEYWMTVNLINKTKHVILWLYTLDVVILF